MRTILFLRKFRKVSGGQIKVRDYFEHCLRHPALDPYIYFTADSIPDEDGLWSDVPSHRRLYDLDAERFDLIFVAGRDWRFLPESLDERKVINLVQNVRHGVPTDTRFEYLRRPAFRICVSEEVRTAIVGHVSGEAVAILNGIPLEYFRANAEGRCADSIFIWGKKNRELGARLYHTLRARGLDVSILTRVLPREEFAAMLRRTDIFVTLPHDREGAYLPPIEAMAAGCAVVCSDAVGNRGYCLDHETCLTPRFDDFDEHMVAVDLLLEDRALREQLRAGGSEMAEAHSLEGERAQFYRLLEERYPDLREGTLSVAERGRG